MVPFLKSKYSLQDQQKVNFFLSEEWFVAQPKAQCGKADEAIHAGAINSYFPNEVKTI